MTLYSPPPLLDNGWMDDLVADGTFYWLTVNEIKRILLISA